MTAAADSHIKAAMAASAAEQQSQHELTHRPGKEHEAVELAARAYAEQWDGVPCEHGVVPAAHLPPRPPDGVNKGIPAISFPFHYLCACCGNIVWGSFQGEQQRCGRCVPAAAELVSENTALWATDSFYEQVMLREPALHHVGVSVERGQRVLLVEMAAGVEHGLLPLLHCGLPVRFKESAKVPGRPASAFLEEYAQIVH